MKRLLKLSIIFLSFISINLFVEAKDTAGLSTDTDPSQYNKMKSEFDKEDSNLEKVNVDSPEWVTIYGMSECNGTSCSVMYAGQYSDYKDVLKRKVVCTNGEKSIAITPGSGIGQYDTDNKDKFNGIAYWNEDFYVTCTNDGNGELLENGTGSTGATGSTGSTGSTNDDYNSSNTVDPSETGVTEYFIILSIVAIVSYVGMVFVKKLNLFKKI